MPQTRDDLEAELRLANENVDRLLTAIASTPPAELSLRTNGGKTLRLKLGKSAPYHFDLFSRDGIKESEGNLRESEVNALRDWLNHYFPKAATA